MENNTDREVTLEFINEILVEDTPEYQQIRELAERDLGKELIESIEKFLEERKQIKPPEEIKKIVFEDASKVTDDQINDVVDAFLKLRSDASIEDFDRRSIDDILSLVNEWILLGKGKKDPDSLAEIYPEFPSGPATEPEEFSLEAQIGNIQRVPVEELYQAESFTPTAMRIYEENKVYHGPEGDFSVHHQEEENPFYKSKSEYKLH